MTGDGPRTPGDLVLHPVALVGLTLLVLNDHVLKGVGPGWLTGKLSDVAGLLFLPFLLLAVYDVVRRGRPPGVRASVVVGVGTGVLFAAVKLLDPVRAAAAAVAGIARAPLDAATALLTGRGAPPVGPVTIVADPSDVLAVAACAAVVLVVRRARRRRPLSGLSGPQLRAGSTMRQPSPTGTSPSARSTAATTTLVPVPETFSHRLP